MLTDSSTAGAKHSSAAPKITARSRLSAICRTVSNALRAPVHWGGLALACEAVWLKCAIRLSGQLSVRGPFITRFRNERLVHHSVLILCAAKVQMAWRPGTMVGLACTRLQARQAGSLRRRSA